MKLAEKENLVKMLIENGLTKQQIQNTTNVSRTTINKVRNKYNLTQKLIDNYYKYYTRVIGYMICKYKHRTNLKRCNIWHVNNTVYYLCSECKCGYLPKDLIEVKLNE